MSPVYHLMSLTQEFTVSQPIHPYPLFAIQTSNCGFKEIWRGHCSYETAKSFVTALNKLEEENNKFCEEGNDCRIESCVFCHRKHNIK